LLSIFEIAVKIFQKNAGYKQEIPSLITRPRTPEAANSSGEIASHEVFRKYWFGFDFDY
jgi:hypothetical protein